MTRTDILGAQLDTAPVGHYRVLDEFGRPIYAVNQAGQPTREQVAEVRPRTTQTLPHEQVRFIREAEDLEVVIAWVGVPIPTTTANDLTPEDQALWLLLVQAAVLAVASARHLGAQWTARTILTSLEVALPTTPADRLQWPRLIGLHIHVALTAISDGRVGPREDQ